MNEKGAVLFTLLKVLVIGIVIVAAAKLLLFLGSIALAILGVVFGLAVAFIVTAGIMAMIVLILFGPFLLVGWLMLRTWRWLFAEPSTY